MGEPVRSRTWATVALFLPQCRARYPLSGPSPHRPARCIRRVWHRGAHRSGSAVWARVGGPLDWVATGIWWAGRLVADRRRPRW